MGPTNKLWFNPQLHQSNFCGVFCRLDSPVLVESRNFFDSKFDSGWWFGTMFIFPYIGNNHPNWLSYFSEGLKPPTRIWFHVWVRSIPLVAGFSSLIPTCGWINHISRRFDDFSPLFLRSSRYFRWLSPCLLVKSLCFRSIYNYLIC